MKILVTGPLRGASGYSHASRNVVKSLIHHGADVVTRNLVYDDYEYKVSPQEQLLYEKPLKDIDALLQFTTPNEMRVKPGIFNSCYFFWETTRIPPYWVQQLNQMDLIFVPCVFNAQVLQNCGITKPVVVAYPQFDMDIYSQPSEPLDIPEVKDKVVFYNINQLSAKKGIDGLIKAYFTSFFDIPNDVILVLKLYINMTNRQNEMSIIKNFIEQVKAGLKLPIQKYPPIYVIPEFLDDPDIQRLHKTGHIYVNSSLGEGWGWGPFEAMAHGNILISSKHGGMQEYVHDNNAIGFGGQLAPVFGMQHPDPYLYTGLEKWFEPNVVEMGIKMRQVFEAIKNPSPETIKALSAIKDAARETTKKFDYRSIGPQFLRAIELAYNSWKTNGVVKVQDLQEVAENKISGGS